jgi:hypothetical protein
MFMGKIIGMILGQKNTLTQGASVGKIETPAKAGVYWLFHFLDPSFRWGCIVFYIGNGRRS